MANPSPEPRSNIDAGSGADAVTPLITIWLRANCSLPFELADVCGTNARRRFLTMEDLLCWNRAPEDEHYAVDYIATEKSHHFDRHWTRSVRS